MRMLVELVEVRDHEVALRVVARHGKREHEWFAHERVEWVGAEPAPPKPTRTPTRDRKSAAAGEER
jgi:hypothetical protein